MTIDILLKDVTLVLQRQQKRHTKMVKDRLKLDWYESRLQNNERIKDFLISKIKKTDIDLGIDYNKLYLLNYEDLFELAVACINKSISITLGANKDYDDRSDAKFAISQFRNNNKKKGHWTNSIRVVGASEKEGPLRVCAYNKLADCFHFFFIPHSAFQHISKTGVIEITLERVSGQYYKPNFNGIPSKHTQWWQYEVDTFEEMCTLKPGDVRLRKKRSLSDTYFEALFDEE